MLLSIRKTIKRSDPAIYFNYKVYNTKTKEIIKQGAFRGLSIDWHDNTSLKLVPYIGMEQKPTSDNPEDALASSKNTHTQITIIKLNN